MKTLISILAGLAVAYGVFFHLDPMIIEWALKTAEVSEDNVGMVRVGLWAILLCFSTGFVLGVSAFIGIIVRAILD